MLTVFTPVMFPWCLPVLLQSHNFFLKCLLFKYQHSQKPLIPSQEKKHTEMQENSFAVQCFLDFIFDSSIPQKYCKQTRCIKTALEISFNIQRNIKSSPVICIKLRASSENLNLFSFLLLFKTNQGQQMQRKKNKLWSWNLKQWKSGSSKVNVPMAVLTWPCCK